MAVASPVQSTMQGEVSHRRGFDWTAAVQWVVAVHTHKTHAPVAQRSFRLLIIVPPSAVPQATCSRVRAPACEQALGLQRPTVPGSHSIGWQSLGMSHPAGAGGRLERLACVRPIMIRIVPFCACPQESWKVTLTRTVHGPSPLLEPVRVPRILRMPCTRTDHRRARVCATW